MNMLEDCAEAAQMPLTKKNSITEARTSTPMGYLNQRGGIVGAKPFGSKPKWLPFSYGTSTSNSVDESFLHEFFPASKISPRSSNESLFETTESSDEELEERQEHVPRDFRLTFQLISKETLQGVDKKNSVELNGYNRIGDRVHIDLSQSGQDLLLPMSSTGCQLQVGLTSSGVTSYLLPLPIISVAAECQKLLEQVTAKLTQEAVTVCLQASSKAPNETFVKLMWLELPLEKFEELMAKRFDLLNLSEELNQVRSIMDISGIIEELSSTNFGSRTVQRLLSMATPNEIDLLVEMMTGKLDRLAVDGYGNYVFQKLLQSCSLEHRIAALTSLINHLPSILQTKTGTHAMQSLLLTASCIDELELYLQGISGHEVLLSCNQQSTHFIQRLLGFPVDSLHQTIFQSFQELSQDQFGVIVVKTFMETTAQSEWRYHVLLKLQASLSLFIQHEFGHYLVQEAFALYGEQDSWTIRQLVLADLVLFGCNAYSSGVIEKMLKHYCRGFTHEILQMFEAFPETLLRLLENKSGSYVVHRVLDTLTGSGKSQLDRLVISSIPKIGGYHSRSKWSKFYGQSTH